MLTFFSAGACNQQLKDHRPPLQSDGHALCGESSHSHCGSARTDLRQVEPELSPEGAGGRDSLKSSLTSLCPNNKLASPLIKCA